MKRILPIVVIGMCGAWSAAAQTSTSVQGGASAQSQTSVQTNKSGAQASGSGSAYTSANAGASAGKSSTDISNGSQANVVSGTKIDATLANSLDAKKSKP